jgi:hypothetical protein
MIVFSRSEALESRGASGLANLRYDAAARLGAPALMAEERY